MIRAVGAIGAAYLGYRYGDDVVGFFHDILVHMRGGGMDDFDDDAYIIQLNEEHHIIESRTGDAESQEGGAFPESCEALSPRCGAVDADVSEIAHSMESGKVVGGASRPLVKDSSDSGVVENCDMHLADGTLDPVHGKRVTYKPGAEGGEGGGGSIVKEESARCGPEETSRPGNRSILGPSRRWSRLAETSSQIIMS